MKITDVTRAISTLEGGKINLSIAQIAEVLWCLNTVTSGAFYKWVRGLK